MKRLVDNDGRGITINNKRIRINEEFFSEFVLATKIEDIPSEPIRTKCYKCNREYDVSEYGEKFAIIIFKVCPVCKNHIYHLP